MIRTINRTTYNTKTAEFIEDKNRGEFVNELWFSSEELYKTRKGKYFLYCYGNAGSMWAHTDKTGAMTGGERIIPVPDKLVSKWQNDIMDAADILRASY